MEKRKKPENAHRQKISESRQAEEQLRSASLYARSLIEASLDPLVTISPDGKITDVNKATEKVTGRGRSELIGTDFSDYFTEPDKARQGYRKVFTNGFVTDYPLALQHCDGHITDVLYNASLYRNEAGEVLGVFAAARDITERKRADEARFHLAAIVESSNDAIIGKDIDGNITSWNKGAEQIYGYTAKEVIGNHITMLANPVHHAEIREFLEKIRKGEPVVNHESERVRKDGSLIQVALTLSPIKDTDGNIVGISTIARDITERKRAEVVLRESEAALREAQRIGHLGSWHMDLATNQVVWSEVLYKMYGFDPALPPPLYTESMKLFTPESWERLSTSIAQTTETGIPYELELEMVNKDGGRGWMLARGELVRDESGLPVRVRGVVMDITMRKLAEEKLRESEKKFKAMTDTSPLAIYMSTGIEQKAEYINPTFTKLFGYTIEEVPTATDWWPLAYPDEKYRKHVEEEWQMKVEQAIKTSSAIEPMEVVVTCKDGSKKNILWGYISTGLQNWAFGMDLTELKRAEYALNALKDDLENQVRARTTELEAANKELEAFAYSVSHDLRAPLRHIDGFVNLLVEGSKKTMTDKELHYLEVIHKSNQKMSKLIDDLLSFSRLGRNEMIKNEIDLKKLIQDIINDFEPDIHGRDVIWRITDLPLIQGDRSMMRVVLVNLISNALKFTKLRPQAIIEISSMTGAENETIVFIRDNGVGFDSRYVDKLFGVFQRLHSESEFEGTGIGLANVRRIISRHGGRVWAEGKVNQGATFYFSLPA